MQFIRQHRRALGVAGSAIRMALLHRMPTRNLRHREATDAVLIPGFTFGLAISRSTHYQVDLALI